jgi:uncharacterized protein (DUF58 family)
LIRPGPVALLGLALCMAPALAMSVDPGAGAWLVLGVLAWSAITIGAATRLPRAEHVTVELRIAGTPRLARSCRAELLVGNQHFRHLRIEGALRHVAPVEVTPGHLLAWLAPGERLSVGLELFSLRRGVHELGVLRLSLRGPFGWLERVVELPLETPLRVHPTPMSPRLLEALYPRALPHLRQPTPRRELFSGLRPFVAGDDARDLCWSASARSQQPMVRSWEGPREGPVLLLLDRGAGMAVAMDAVHSRMDRAVATATGLLRVLEAHGREVTVAAWSHDLDLWIPPSRRDATTALASLEAAAQPWDPSRLGEALRPRLAPNTSVLIITEPDGEPEALALALTALSRYAVRLLLVGDPGLRAAAATAVSTREQAFTLAAAMALADQRREAISRWRRTGAEVIDAGSRRQPVAR